MATQLLTTEIEHSCVYTGGIQCGGGRLYTVWVREAVYSVGAGGGLQCGGEVDGILKSWESVESRSIETAI